ncbi:MAG: protein phosphatase 2C domain-containing protein [Oscillospiraceae bacterium]|nr:protein phosphatase 2C domain-containing protein [Oscillospiraceae bacterium]
MKLDSYCYTNIGGREENQDAVGRREEGENGLYIVADGLGGHQAGHLSAQCAVRTLSERWDPESPETPEHFAGFFADINDAILAIQEETHLTTKTTTVALSVQGGRAVWAHTGDSRLYYIHGGKLAAYTADHSVAYKKYQAGEITREQIPMDEDQSFLLRALGGPKRFEPDAGGADALQAGDAFLLCSDGLWEYLTDAEIVDDCLRASTAEAWAGALLRRAAARIKPGNDNLSLITVKLHD